jgi:hypothetical protein
MLLWSAAPIMAAYRRTVILPAAELEERLATAHFQTVRWSAIASQIQFRQIPNVTRRAAPIMEVRKPTVRSKATAKAASIIAPFRTALSFVPVVGSRVKARRRGTSYVNDTSGMRLFFFAAYRLW